MHMYRVFLESAASNKHVAGVSALWALLVFQVNEYISCDNQFWESVCMEDNIEQ